MHERRSTQSLCLDLQGTQVLEKDLPHILKAIVPRALEVQVPKGAKYLCSTYIDPKVGMWEPL